MSHFRFSQMLVLPFLFLLFLFDLHAQAAQITVDEIVERAARQSLIYVETFKNLLSEEKKTFEVFDKKGIVKKRRIVDSTFLVYQLTKEEGRIAEFRSVVAVDGKRLDKIDERAQDFFEKVIVSESSQKEMNRVRDESTRYDEDFAISGLTLFQAVTISENLRKSFRFNLLGKESVDGKENYLIEYEQVAANPAITINASKNADDRFSNNYDVEIDDEKPETNPRFRGKLWIDAETFNVRKEIRNLTIQPSGFQHPLPVSENVFEYVESSFSILTPKTITHLQYRIKIKDGLAMKDTKIEFVYGKFTKPDVEVKSAEVKDKN